MLEDETPTDDLHAAVDASQAQELHLDLFAVAQLLAVVVALGF